MDEMKRIEPLGRDIMREAYFNTKILGFKRMSRVRLIKEFSSLTGRSWIYSAWHILFADRGTLDFLQLTMLYCKAKEWAIKHT